MSASQVFEGFGAHVEVTSEGIVIRRKGLVSFANHGLKGEKRIPFASITAVQFKPSGTFTSGYIQFSILGGAESRGGLLSATSDENSVLFKGAKQSASFERLREIVEASSKAARPSSATVGSSIADDLTKLANLLERGILTPEEFAAQKALLLNR